MGNGPPSEPQGSPPSGATGAEGRCCPAVSTFDGTRSVARLTGFDPRTNLAQARGSDEYWIPPDAAKTAPTDPMTQDGAAWVSVTQGESTEVEIGFEGQESNACIGNSTFELSAEGLVLVTPNRVSSSGAALAIEGLSPGETTLKVICEGRDLGWLHIVCYAPIDISVSIGCITSGLGRTVAYSASGLQVVLRQVFRAAGINVTVTDAGRIDLTSNAVVAGLETGMVHTVPNSYFSEGFGELRGQRALLGDINGHGGAYFGALTQIAALASAQAVAPGQIRMWYYVPGDDLPSRNSGVALGIPSDQTFAFKDFLSGEGGYGMADSYAVLAHELGHNLGLAHPNDPSRVGPQLPSHLVASNGLPVEAEPATNTEPAIVPHPLASIEKNRVAIMNRDPLNLMGYWPVFTQQLFLRKQQWDAARANVPTGP